jgi:hypothetical protein
MSTLSCSKQPKLASKIHVQAADQSALDHAARLIHRVCCLAGSSGFVDEIRADNRSIRAAIERYDTAVLFDWLMVAFSHQGVSDRVAHDYMDSTAA